MYWVCRRHDRGASVAVHMECVVMHLKWQDSKGVVGVSINMQEVTAVVCFMHGGIPEMSIYSKM